MSVIREDALSSDFRLIIETIYYVCGFPDREEKWQTLKALTDVLVIATGNLRQ